MEDIDYKNNIHEKHLESPVNMKHGNYSVLCISHIAAQTHTASIHVPHPVLHPLTDN